jgi:hypothetical protein
MTKRSWEIHLNFKSTFCSATFRLVSGQQNGAKSGVKYDVRDPGLAKHKFPYALVYKKDSSDVLWGTHASDNVQRIKNDHELERRFDGIENFETLLRKDPAGSLPEGKSITDIFKDYTIKLEERAKDEMKQCGYKEGDKLEVRFKVPTTWPQAITTLLEEHGTLNEDLGLVSDTEEDGIAE